MLKTTGNSLNRNLVKLNKHEYTEEKGLMVKKQEKIIDLTSNGRNAS